MNFVAQEAKRLFKSKTVACPRFSALNGLLEVFYMKNQLKQISVCLCVFLGIYYPFFAVANDKKIHIDFTHLKNVRGIFSTSIPAGWDVEGFDSGNMLLRAQKNSNRRASNCTYTFVPSQERVNQNWLDDNVNSKPPTQNEIDFMKSFLSKLGLHIHNISWQKSTLGKKPAKAMLYNGYSQNSLSPGFIYNYSLHLYRSMTGGAFSITCSSWADDAESAKIEFERNSEEFNFIFSKTTYLAGR